jgi:hypothetical protein
VLVRAPAVDQAAAAKQKRSTASRLAEFPNDDLLRVSDRLALCLSALCRFCSACGRALAFLQGLAPGRLTM